jgi:hypothetical protein
MIVLSCMLACALAAATAATIVSAEPADITVAATTAGPVLLAAYCFVPTREELASRRITCDDLG